MYRDGAANSTVLELERLGMDIKVVHEIKLRKLLINGILWNTVVATRCADMKEELTLLSYTLQFILYGLRGRRYNYFLVSVHAHTDDTAQNFFYTKLDRL